MSEKSLYQSLVDAGVEVGNHESDLYFENTPKSRQVLDGFPQYTGGMLGRFTNGIDGKPWFEAPFAYLPWGEAKKKSL